MILKCTDSLKEDIIRKLLSFRTSQIYIEYRLLFNFGRTQNLIIEVLKGIIFEWYLVKFVESTFGNKGLSRSFKRFSIVLARFLRQVENFDIRLIITTINTGGTLFESIRSIVKASVLRFWRFCENYLLSILVELLVQEIDLIFLFWGFLKLLE